MAIWDFLFGKKVSVQHRDDSGALVEKKITENQLAQLVGSGVIHEANTVDVLVLDPKGDHSETWVIGKDVSAEIAKAATDPESRLLHAIRTYENGTPKTLVCTKSRWLEFSAKYQAIDREGEIARSHAFTRPVQSRPNATTEPASIPKPDAKLAPFPRCSRNVIVGSPDLDDAYTCTLIFDTEAITRWFSPAISDGTFSGHHAVLTAPSLLNWLESSDKLNPTPTLLPMVFYRLIQSYICDLVTSEAFVVRCAECDASYAEINEEVVDRDRHSLGGSYRTVWKCPAGHLLYNHLEEIHISPMRR